jgi:hypothetical protein
MKILFCLFVISSFLQAANSKFFLYDVKSNDKIKVEYPLKANRMYVYFDNEFKSWVYTKTNKTGNFSKPLEIYKPGTTLPADVFGLESRDFYSLTDSGKWIKYGHYAVHKVVVKDSINREVTRYPKDVPMPAPAPKFSKKSK